MPRYTPPSHEDERLANGSLTFYESGSATLKTIYADDSELTAIANPVTLGSNGQEPNIFYSGSARVVGKDSDGVQVFDRDPVGGESQQGNLSDWNSILIYGATDLVIGSNGKYYKSIQNSNQGNDPTLSPGSNAFWEEVNFLGLYNSSISYSTADAIQDSNGRLYYSVVNSNLGNDPMTDDGTNWAEFMIKGDYGLGATALSNAPNNDLNDVTETGFYRTIGSTANTPVVDSGSTVLCMAYDSTNQQQIFLGQNGNNAYYRSKASGTWLNWIIISSNTATTIQNGGTQIIAGSATTGLNVTEINRWGNGDVTYTLDESAFNIGDKVIVRSLTDIRAGVITITTDTGTMTLPDGTTAASNTIPTLTAMTAEFHKIDATNWRVSVY